MFKIGIIGSENSHALAFSQIYNAPENAKFDCRVVAIMGEDPEASQKIFSTCGLDFIAKSPADMLGKVDAVMVTSRNGALHPGYARPFLERGMPVFLDKPIANDAAEALELMRLSVKSGSPVMGGSSTKFVADVVALKEAQAKLVQEGKALGGSVWAPVSMENPYGGFYFYASHLVEITLAIFGQTPLRVSASRVGAGIVATLMYDSFQVSLHYMNESYHYGATLLSKDQADSRVIDISDCYNYETEHFAHMLATGEMPQTRHDLIKPVYLLNAIEAAYMTGTVQEIADDYTI